MVIKLIEKILAVDSGVAIGNKPYNYAWTWAIYVQEIYGFALRLGAVLATLMIVVSGYLYLTSSGDPGKTKIAKEFLFGAILGYVLLLIIGLLLDFLGAPSYKL